MASLAIEALELEVLHSPGCVKVWLQLIKAVQATDFESATAKANAINILYERAIRANGFSYKLWMSYIVYRRDHTRIFSSIFEWFRAVRDIYDRAVVNLPMMPLLWISFIQFVMDASVPPRITLVRHTISRALEALPVTQHYRVWKLAKQWVLRSYVPTETAQFFWRLFLLFDPRAENQRDYFVMLWEKGSTSEFLVECAVFLLDGNPHENFLADTAFWEMIRVAFETKDLHFTGDFVLLEKMLGLAVTHCASPAEFQISYAVFLTGQGKFSVARETLWKVLEDADNPSVFLKAFNAAVTFEDQIVESLAMDPSIQALNGAAYQCVCEKLCGDAGDPLKHLLHLTQQYPLLLNQLQLREDRYNTAIWLKRAELLREMVSDGRASHSDVIALYRQAITQCTSGLQAIDAGVAQLCESHACYLWENGYRTDAVAVVKDGAWYVDFSSSTSNVLLLGLLLEFALLRGNSTEFLEDLLRKLQIVNGSERNASSIRTKGLIKSVVVPHLKRDPRAWILALDVAFHRSSERVGRVIDLFSASCGYTAEGACYVAARLWHGGNKTQAFQEFERALVSFKEFPLALLYILEQYLSCLCISFGERLPLHRLRELTRLGFEVAPATMPSCPVASVEFLLNCSALESRLGLSGNAVSIAQESLHLALRHCSESDGDGDSFIMGLVDTVLDITFTLQGSQLVRKCCIKLLEQRQLTPQSIQRVALWWAAVEKRTGNIDKAHTVMDACCKSQDPSSSHGSIFWSLWESICTTVAQFEGVNKRRQQVTLKYAGNTATAPASAPVQGGA